MSFFDVPLESRIRYLQRRQDELHKLSQAQNEELFELAKKMGHQIKGNAINFGFETLTTFAEQMEKASIRREESEIRRAQNEIAKKVQEFLHQLS